MSDYELEGMAYEELEPTEAEKQDAAIARAEFEIRMGAEEERRQVVLAVENKLLSRNQDLLDWCAIFIAYNYTSRGSKFEMRPILEARMLALEAQMGVEVR